MSGYLKREKLGSLYSFKKKVALAELQEALTKCKEKYASNARFCDHITNVKLAATAESERIVQELLYDILDGKNRTHADGLRILMKNEFVEETLNFLIDVRTAARKLANELDKKKRMDEYENLIDTYDIRGKGSSDLNFKDQLRKEWVTYLEKDMEEECDEAMQKAFQEVKMNIAVNQFAAFWKALKN